MGCLPHRKRMNIKNIAFRYLFLLFVPSLACVQATTLYVSTSGSDSNPGTSTQPFRTITFAYGKAGAGTTILVAPGVYTDYTSGWGLHLGSSGSASSPIVLQSQVRGGAIIDGQNASDRNEGIYLDGSYNVVDGFEIRNGTQGGICVYGSGNQILHNEIHHNGNLASSSTNGRDGIYSDQNTSGNIYTGNYIHDNGRQGSNLDHGLYLCGKNELVNNNISLRNAACGLQVAGYSTVSNLRVYNNVIAWNGTDGIILWMSLSGVDIRNNVLYENGHYGIGSYAASGSGVVVDHNLAYGNGYGAYDFTGGGSTYSYSLGTSITSDPAFVNESSSGFDAHFAAGSPAIGAGLNFSSVFTTDMASAARPASGAWDLGSYVYNTTSGTATPPTVSLTANPTTISSGQSTTLTWTSANATSVSLSGVGSVSLSGNATDSPTTTTTYTVTATGPGGTASASATVTVTAATASAPTVTLTASPATITSGQAATLTWKSANATSVTWVGYGSVSLNGSAGVWPSTTTTYTVTATGPGGTTSASATVTVSGTTTVSTGTAPTVTLTANPTTVSPGQATTLTWTSANATSMTWVDFGAVSLNGNAGVWPNATTTYTVTATGPGGSQSASVTVTVSGTTSSTSGGAPSVTLTATPASITQGQAATLTWTSANATSLTWVGVGPVSLNGNAGVWPNATTTYTVTATGPGGTSSATATVTVSSGTLASLRNIGSAMSPAPGRSLIRIEGQRMAGPGLFQIYFAAQRGQTYQVQASTNYQDWMPLGSVTAANQDVSFLDGSSAGYPNRFYRVIQQAPGVTTAQ